MSGFVLARGGTFLLRKKEKQVMILRTVGMRLLLMSNAISIFKRTQFQAPDRTIHNCQWS